MSKAFTKEDDETPERANRRRSGAGLPPGALNYLSERGALVLRSELAELEGRMRDGDRQDSMVNRVETLRGVLDTATIVPTRTETPEEVLFGTTVIVQAPDGARGRYRIVGVDEAGLEIDWVSWVSPVAKTLLGAQVGQILSLPEVGKVEVLEILA